MSFRLNYADFVSDYWGPAHCISPVAEILGARAPRAPWSRRYMIVRRTKWTSMILYCRSTSGRCKLMQVCRSSSLFTGRNVRWPRRMMPLDESRWGRDRRTDARPLHYAFHYGRGQRKNDPRKSLHLYRLRAVLCLDGLKCGGKSGGTRTFTLKCDTHA